MTGIFKRGRYLRLDVHLVSTNPGTRIRRVSSAEETLVSRIPTRFSRTPHALSSLFRFFLFPVVPPPPPPWPCPRIFLPPIAHCWLSRCGGYVIVTSTNFISYARRQKHYSGRGTESLGSRNDDNANQILAVTIALYVDPDT